jgi:hypothetical protein
MQDRPTAVELLKAAQEFCERDLLPSLTGRVRFHARVLQNVLGILEREWQHEEAAARTEWERLRTLLGETTPAPDTFQQLGEEVGAWNRELGARIRSGDLDERWDETVEAVYESVVAKLAIANPRYSEAASSTET